MGSQLKWTCFLVSSHSGDVRSASFVEKPLRYVTMPRMVWSLKFDGVCILQIASSFSFAGWIPFSVKTCPKKSTCVCLNCSFSEFRLTLGLRVASSILQKALSCSDSVEPRTTMSSAIPITFGMSLYTSSSLRWKMSWESLTPKGNRLKRYRPKGVLKVHSKIDSWFKATCQ